MWGREGHTLVVRDVTQGASTMLFLWLFVSILSGPAWCVVGPQAAEYNLDESELGKKVLHERRFPSFPILAKKVRRRPSALLAICTVIPSRNQTHQGNINRQNLIIFAGIWKQDNVEELQLECLKTHWPASLEKKKTGSCWSSPARRGTYATNHFVVIPNPHQNTALFSFLQFPWAFMLYCETVFLAASDQSCHHCQTLLSRTDFFSLNGHRLLPP